LSLRVVVDNINDNLFKVLPPSSRKDKGVPGKEDTNSSESESSSDERKTDGENESQKDESENSDSSEEIDQEMGDLQPPAKSGRAAGCAGGHPGGGATPPEEAAKAEEVQGKVKRYLEGIAKQRNVNLIRERLGPDNIVYNSIQERFKQDTVASNLMGEEPVQLPHMDGLVDMGDGRILSGGLKIDIGEKKVVCCSFDSEWRCLQCEHHKEKSAFKIRGIADSSSAPQVVILADQSFPACLPSGSEKDCVKILIMEGGSLKELVEEFFSRLGNRRVPPGSAVLLFSMSWLAVTGVVGYAEELIAVCWAAQELAHRPVSEQTVP
jgi:hypothetical protein